MSSDASSKIDDGIYGDDYIALMDANPESRRTRRNFQEIALSLVKPGSTIFEFGSGPGVDAKHYAAHGCKVIAYDNDPRMCQSLVHHCARELRSDQIQLIEGPYQDFLSGNTRVACAPGSIDLITANFAPLTLVSDLQQLFATFALLTTAGGRVLASVLNPWFLGDLRYRWWWNNRKRYWREGEFAVPGALGPIWRRSSNRIAHSAASAFRLSGIYCGHATRNVSDHRSSHFLIRPAFRYLFLLFDKP